MSNIFLTLFLLSFVGLAIGLIRPTTFKTTRKRASIIFGVSIVVFFILFGMTAPSKPSGAVSAAATTGTASQTPSTPSQTSSAPAVAAPQTLDQRIATYAPQVYGNGITFTKTEKQSDGSVLITLNITNIVGKSTFRTKTGALSARIFQDAYVEYPKAPEVSVIYTGDKVDTYGKTTNGTLMSYFLTKPTFAKFDWGNFQTFTLCDTLRSAGESEDAAADFTDGCAIFTSDLR